MNSKLFKIEIKDVSKALVVAVIGGAVFPVLVAIQTTGFNILTASWHDLGVLAINGAVTGFASYIIKNYLSDSEGKVLGRWG